MRPAPVGVEHSGAFWVFFKVDFLSEADLVGRTGNRVTGCCDENSKSIKIPVCSIKLTDCSHGTRIRHVKVGFEFACNVCTHEKNPENSPTKK